jgi:hypothetical protein
LETQGRQLFHRRRSSPEKGARRKKIIAFLDADYFRRSEECKNSEGEPCGECEECPHYEEAFSKFSPGYAAYVSQLIRGIARIKFNPTVDYGYSLRETDLMLLIIQHEESKAVEEPTGG